MSNLNFNEKEAIEIDFQEFFKKLLKYRWKLIYITVVSIAAALIVSFMQTPVYRATSRLMVDSKPPKIIKVEDVVLPEYSDHPNFFNSQIEVLKSYTLAEMV